MQNLSLGHLQGCCDLPLSPFVDLTPSSLLEEGGKLQTFLSRKHINCFSSVLSIIIT